MEQQNKVDELKNNPRQAKQFNAVAEVVNEAIKKEFPVFLKLVQFDTMVEIQKKLAADKVGEADSPEKQITESLDQIISQIGKDLEAQLTKHFDALK